MTSVIHPKREGSQQCAQILKRVYDRIYGKCNEYLDETQSATESYLRCIRVPYYTLSIEACTMTQNIISGISKCSATEEFQELRYVSRLHAEIIHYIKMKKLELLELFRRMEWC